MTLDQIAAALAAASLLTASTGSGDAWEGFPRACTPEVQRCLDKLEWRLRLHDSVHDWARIEQALLELHATDPECALLLQGRALHGL